MKILYCIAGTRHSGGMERVLANKANWLAGRGHEVVIVTTDQCGEAPCFKLDPRIRQIDLGVNYEENNGKSFFNKAVHYPGKVSRHRKRLAAVLAGERPDVAVSMMCNDADFICGIGDGSAKVLESHFSRSKRMLYGRKGLWALADRWRTRKDMHRAKEFDKFVVLTQEDAKAWGEMPNMEVIPNACSFAAASPAPLVARKAIAVGRLCRQKGFERLIEAWAAVAAEHPDWRLEIIGDGEDKEQLLRQISDLGLDGQIAIIPKIEDMAAAYAGASMLVSSSRYEGLPMVMLEAMACGLPIVSFDCPCGPRDVINDGVTGILVPEGDVMGLARGICALIEDEEKRRSMGQNAYAESKKYSEDEIMARWEQLFASVCKR